MEIKLWLLTIAIWYKYVVNFFGSMFLKSTLPWLSVCVVALCSANYLLIPYNGAPFLALALDQAAPLNPLSWLGAHLTHSDGNHLLWNMAAMAVLGYLIESYNRKLLVVSLLAGVVVLDGWFFIQGQFDRYVGLSGVLNTLLVVALYTLRRPQTVWRGNEVLWLVLLLATVKSIYELLHGGALFSNTRWLTTPSFHFVGIAVGVVVVLAWRQLGVAGGAKG